MGHWDTAHWDIPSQNVQDSPRLFHLIANSMLQDISVKSVS